MFFQVSTECAYASCVCPQTCLGLCLFFSTLANPRKVIVFSYHKEEVVQVKDLSQECRLFWFYNILLNGCIIYILNNSTIVLSNYNEKWKT